MIQIHVLERQVTPPDFAASIILDHHPFHFPPGNKETYYTSKKMLCQFIDPTKDFLWRKFIVLQLWISSGFPFFENSFCCVIVMMDYFETFYAICFFLVRNQNKSFLPEKPNQHRFLVIQLRQHQQSLFFTCFLFLALCLPKLDKNIHTSSYFSSLHIYCHLRLVVSGSSLQQALSFLHPQKYSRLSAVAGKATKLLSIGILFSKLSHTCGVPRTDFHYKMFLVNGATYILHPVVLVCTMRENRAQLFENQHQHQT